MRVIYIPMNQQPYVIDIPHTLSEMQRLVGGRIEVVEPFADNVMLVCNEDGRIEGKPVNRIIMDGMDICGDFFLCGHDGIGLSDFPEDLIEKYTEVFRNNRIIN